MLHRLDRARCADSRRLRRFRLQAHLRRAQRVHDRRSVGVLFRYPQGRALLRSVFVGHTQSLPDRARPSVPLHGDLARADAVLHRRRGVAGARSRRDVRASRSRFPTVPASWRDDALAEKWRKLRNLRRVVTGALEIERAESASAHRSRRRRSFMSPIPIFSASRSRPTSPNCASRPMRLWSRARGRLGVPARRRGGGRGRAAPCAGPQMRPLLEDLASRWHRSAISRCDAARRAGAARMGRDAQGGGVGVEMTEAAHAACGAPTPGGR